MNLGELFYFTSQINRIHSRLTPDTVSSLELLGVNKADLLKASQSTPRQISRVVKDIFLNNFLNKVQKSELEFAKSFWTEIASPLAEVSINLHPRSEYQESLVDWLKDEADLEKLPEMVSHGYLTTSLEDYVCFYGLAVLEALNEKGGCNSSSPIEPVKKLSTAKITFSSEPEILVLTNSYLEPIFKNFNCRTLNFTNSQKKDVQNIIDETKKYNSIKLILVTETMNEKLEKYLKRKIGEDVIISYVNLKSNEKDSYFDDLVRATLGVRLT